MDIFPQQHSGAAGKEAATEQLAGQARSEQAEGAEALLQARQALALAGTSPADTPTVGETLQHDSLKEQALPRQAASEMLTALAAAEQQKQSVDTMMSLLIQETRAARRRRQGRLARNAVAVLGIVFLLLVTHGRILTHFWWVFGGGWWAIDQASSKRGETVRALSKAGDPRAVGVLAVAARDGDISIQQAASDALLNLLPQVRANHASAVTPDQMNALLELAFQSNFWMQLAVLKALEQIGDQRAIPVVQNLTLSSHRAVREQALHCMPYLNERARQAEASATLLRGASSPGMAAGKSELLRPALESADSAPPEELLRPTDAAS